ncbi:MAG: hypothetical protein ACRCZO_12165 [Cetobacterium sp.]
MKGFLINFLFISVLSFSNEGIMLLPSDETMGGPIPSITLPEISDENVEDKWELEKTTELVLESKAKVIVPLEIISDIEIKALVIDNQKHEIPFQIELNRNPERKDYYRLNYTTTKLDIDDDGKEDTQIYSPKFINSKTIDDNKVIIDGSNITKEGVHRKRVYITVEIRDVK